ncbi:MAG: aminotransferase class I/II-fold pyridoxal phosphate-dependent enzyme [Candidatus Phosphoribacter sp.]
MDLHIRTPESLRARRSLKWTAFPPDVLPMWVAEMDFPVCRAVTAALERAVAAESFGYPSPVVAKEVAEATASWLAGRHGWAASTGASGSHGSSGSTLEVHIVSDVMHGVDLGIRHFSGPDDPVVIPAPVYRPFFDVVRSTGRPQLTLPMAWDSERWTFDLEAIDAALAAGGRTVLICSPQNPLGRVFDRAELAGLSAVVEHHGARVISDEIHAPLTFTRPHTPYAACSPEAAAHTITVVSASKAWNLPGLKCAQVITSNAADTATWRAIPFWETVGVSTLGMEATIAAYRQGGEWLAEVTATLAEHAGLVADAVEGWQGVTTVPNEGTYLQWLDFGGLGLDVEPAAWLLDQARVALTGGVPFGGAPHRYARLNFATTRPLLEQGLEQIGAAVRRQAG